MMPSAPGLPSNLASALCYLVPVVGPVVFLVLAPYSRDSKIRFNAFQALLLQFAWFAANIVVRAIGDITWRLSDILSSIIGLAYLVIVVYLIVKSLQNEKVILPYIGPLAEKQR